VLNKDTIEEVGPNWA